MAIRCPHCGNENVHGTYLCANCNSPLNAASVMITTNVIKKGGTGTFVRTQQVRNAHEGKLDQHSIAIYIDPTPNPLIILLTSQTVFGRLLPGEPAVRFDLTPYGAHELGVSRQHAVMKRTDKGIILEDMGSSNGSWLNDTLLKAYSPVLLRSGDRVRLGQLRMEVFFL